MNPAELGVMFVLGLVSSLHCVQMCGPIVLSYSVAVEALQRTPSPGNPPRPIAAVLFENHVAYSFGRILTYSALGAVAGVAGGTLGFVGHLAGFSHALALVSGVLMIGVGVSLFGILPAGRLANRALRVPSSFLCRIGKLISAQRSGNRFLLGLALGFLPCGLIYAALLKAMATGSALHGAASMFAFGLGTAGALLAIGMFSSALRLRLNRWGSQLAAAGVTAMGLFLLWRGSLPNLLLMGGHPHACH